MAGSALALSACADHAASAVTPFLGSPALARKREAATKKQTVAISYSKNQSIVYVNDTKTFTNKLTGTNLKVTFNPTGASHVFPNYPGKTSNTLRRIESPASDPAPALYYGDAVHHVKLEMKNGKLVSTVKRHANGRTTRFTLGRDGSMTVQYPELRGKAIKMNMSTFNTEAKALQRIKLPNINQCPDFTIGSGGTCGATASPPPTGGTVTPPPVTIGIPGTVVSVLLESHARAEGNPERLLGGLQQVRERGGNRCGIHGSDRRLLRMARGCHCLTSSPRCGSMESCSIDVINGLVITALEAAATWVGIFLAIAINDFIADLDSCLGSEGFGN